MSVCAVCRPVAPELSHRPPILSWGTPLLRTGNASVTSGSKLNSMRLPTTARLGIGAIAIAAIVFLGARYWLETRKYVLVDIPVNLFSGRNNDRKIRNKSASVVFHPDRGK